MAALTTFTATHTILETLIGALEGVETGLSSSTTPTPTSTSSAVPPNPLLAYQPPFSRSLVVQLIVLAAVLALHMVLVLHLAFTVRYHFPLARGNYYLLTSGCITSITATIWAVAEALTAARSRSRTWPFMFDYLEVMFPSTGWSTPKKVFWLLLNGFVGFLCHAAHIHMLTLLYPSTIEARLLLALLLPLALISTGLSFSPLLDSQRHQDIFDSGAAVCNSTLTLLYTCALLFWGLYIARPRAWGQGDESGSTAVFGGCAIGMAVLGTILSFISVKRGGEAVGGSGNDGGWLAKVTWVVLLWQTWFGVWWWIGAGMYGAERPLEREDAENERDEAAERAEREGLKGEGRSNNLEKYLPNSLRLRRRRTQRADNAEGGGDARSLRSHESIELQPIHRPTSPSSSLHAQPASSLPPVPPPSSSSSGPSTTTPPTLLSTLFRQIRRAHNRAAAQAHADLLHDAQENTNGVGEALSGRRKGGWSIGGILRSREREVAQRAAMGGRGAGVGEGEMYREERRTGAMRLDDDGDDAGQGADAGSGVEINNDGWEDLSPTFPPTPAQPAPASNLRNRRPSKGENEDTALPPPTESRRFGNWRRRDVTRYD